MLIRRLKKDRYIVSNDVIEATLGTFQTPPAKGIATPKSDEKDAKKLLIESRLSSSKVLAEKIGEHVAALRELVIPKKEILPDTGLGTNNNWSVEDNSDKGEMDWESGSVSDEPRPRISSRVNHNSSGESNSEAENEDENQPILKRSEKNMARLKMHSPLPPSVLSKSDQSEEQSIDNEDKFLPSLTIGYIRGESDVSYPSDSEGSAKGEKKRKNRRGQRARQAIWEKKYGRGARHLVKARNEEGSRESKIRKDGIAKGSGRKVGQIKMHIGMRPFRRDNTASFGERNGPRVGSNAMPGGGEAGRPGTRFGHENKGKKSDGPLHPSWEAAKKRKAQNTSAFGMGKKIVFE